LFVFIFVILFIYFVSSLFLFDFAGETKLDNVVALHFHPSPWRFSSCKPPNSSLTSPFQNHNHTINQAAAQTFSITTASSFTSPSQFTQFKSIPTTN
jgi:hypothetical protein